MSCKTTPLHDGGTAAVFCVIAGHNRIRKDTIMANRDYQSNGIARFFVHRGCPDSQKNTHLGKLFATCRNN